MRALSLSRSLALLDHVRANMRADPLQAGLETLVVHLRDVVVKPAVAQTCAMPGTMRPHPTTADFLVSPSLSFAGGPIPL